jgi:hypothetical protein
VLLEINYKIEGKAEIWLNGKQMTTIEGTKANRARYWFTSRGWGWKLGVNTIEFKGGAVELIHGTITYGYN